MLRYLFVTAKRNRAPLNRAVDRFLLELPFWPSHLTVRQAESSVLIAAEVADAAAAGQRNFSIDADNNFTGFDGLPIGPYLRSPPSQWAHVIGQEVRRDKTRFFEENSGVFGVTFGNVQHNELTAFSDFTGSCPIYFADQADFVAVSNRPGLIGRAVMSVEADLQGLSFLTGQANMFVPFTSYAGVQSLRPGHGVQIDRHGTLRLFTLSRFWTPTTEKSVLDDAVFDVIADRLVSTMKNLANVPFHDITLSLTGGRDSRLCLAAAIAANITPQCWTGGAVDSAEIECARAVAEFVRVPYKAYTFNRSRFSFETYWNRLKFNTSHFDGMLCLFDGGNADPASSRRSKAEIKGLGGEILSIHVKAHKDLSFSSPGEAVEKLTDYQQPMDPLGIQSKNITRWQRSTIARRLKELIDAGADPNDLTDIIHIENRMPLWGGVLGQRLSSLTIQPLNDFTIANTIFNTNAAPRRMWRYHYEAMRRLNPSLVDFPFLGAGWDARLRPYMPRDIQPPFVSTAPATLANIAAVQVLALKEGWRQVSEFLLDHASSRLYEVIDREKLIRVLHDGPNALNGYGVKEIHSVISMQMFLTGMGQRRYEGYNAAAPVLDSNMPDFRIVERNGAWIFRRGHRRGLAATPDTSFPKSLGSNDGTLSALRFKFDAVNPCAIRLDPMDRAGRIIISQVALRKGKKGAVFGPQDFRLVGARLVLQRGDVALLEAFTSDPQIYLPIDLKSWVGKAPLRLEARVLVENAPCNVECFVDLGGGFSRKGMQRVRIEETERSAETFAAFVAQIEAGSGAVHADVVASLPKENRS